jgi:murein DD-endopeptidase MepM/ murein hydrolase activator NlpD
MFILSPAERNLVRETELMQSEYERLNREMENLNKVIDELVVRDKNIYGTVLHSTPLELTEEVDITHYRALVEDPSFALAFHADSVIFGLERRAALVTRALYMAGNRVYGQLDSMKYLPAAFPLREPSMEAMGATIGRRIHPFYKIPIDHTGMDFLAGLGTDVLATAGGQVVNVSRSARGRGNVVEIEHPYRGYKTVYAHLSDIFVRKGQYIERGMVIARVGSSGMSFMPHLHYEIQQNGQVRDPVHYFFMDVMPGEYRQIMLTAYNTGQSLD